jgi:hypothetical protein
MFLAWTKEDSYFATLQIFIYAQRAISTPLKSLAGRNRDSFNALFTRPSTRLHTSYCSCIPTYAKDTQQVRTVGAGSEQAGGVVTLSVCIGLDRS